MCAEIRPFSVVESGKIGRSAPPTPSSWSQPYSSSYHHHSSSSSLMGRMIICGADHPGTMSF